ncbi:MAG TPA: azurin [Steroidobacteraceae bacterium]|jgi:azurin|nr:azurin [Steroidobacteraceae bacterium]
MKAIRAIACLSVLFAAPGAFAADKVCKVDIAGTDMMQYDKKEIVVAADCTQVELTLKHTGKQTASVMGHNWVLTRTADVAAVATDGMGAGLPNDYIKKDDARVLAHTKVVAGGQSASVTFATSLLKKGESYSFFCSFPGHYAVMKGAFKFG